MRLTVKQKNAIESGDGPRNVVLQLNRKGLAEPVEEEDVFRHPETKAKMAEVHLTEEGEDVKRMIEDPTIDHVRPTGQ